MFWSDEIEWVEYIIYVERIMSVTRRTGCGKDNGAPPEFYVTPYSFNLLGNTVSRAK